MSRRRIAAVGVAALALVGLAPATPSVAAPPVAEVCAGVPPSDFCLTHGAATTAPGTATSETRAAAPFDLEIAMSNTSPAHADVAGKPRWWKSISVDLLSSSTTAMLLAPSTSMPDELMISGSALPCGVLGDFSSCTAGRGSVLVEITGLLAGNGVHTANFGIQRIVNERETSNLVEYDVHYTLCVPTPLGACTVTTSGVLVAAVPQPSGGSTTRTLSMPATGTSDVAVPPFGTAHLDFSLDTSTVLLGGRSSMLGTGAPAETGSTTCSGCPRRAARSVRRAPRPAGVTWSPPCRSRSPSTAVPA